MAGHNHNIFSPDSENQDSKSDLHKITHDLNNILNYIINGLELITENLDSRPTITSLLDKLKKNSILASNIISNISDKNLQKSFKEKISLNKVIKESIELYELKQESKQIISYENNSSNNFIWGNFVDINRILLNILGNAKEADPNAKISISLDQYSNKSIELRIKDDGPGISNNVIKHIFEEGYSTKQNFENKNKGLGLSIVNEIVEEYNGKINVESEIGKGTLFRIVFPLYRKNELRKTFTGKTIIIAEDDPFQLEVLKDLLCSLQIKALSASNGSEVLNLLDHHNPDLIFMDRTMPVMDGLECIKQINQKELNIPIVLTSGADIESLSNDPSITEVLKKPYSFEMIQNILERLL